MTPESVLAKSSKGHEEIDQHTYRLSPKLRQALIRVDGVKTIEEHLESAGDRADALYAQFEELERGGFLVDTTPAAEPVTEPVPPPPPPPPPAPVARAPAPAAPKPAPAPAPAPARTPAPAASPEPERESAAVEFNSPVKFRLLDLLVDAIGGDTGKIGAALAGCRNREDLSRWVVAAFPRIQEQAGKAKATKFYKEAKKLVGG